MSARRRFDPSPAPHPNATRFDDREQAALAIHRGKRLQYALGKVLKTGDAVRACEHDRGATGKTRSEFGEVSIGGDDDPSLTDGEPHDLGIGRTPRDGADGAHSVTSIDPPLDDRSVNVLVDERVDRGTG
jgi:hypothetical protein